ncbi:hypothetical protein BOTBODRAFT_116465 [Botryobasidium botryosum FD-172 SS1]|uniref:Uncharacterized protein n=1 Tax=Botryobasidium botryosum (strain FD-172 SS1) TaxID=930990 RepID=A0A067M5M2_BOTB1|nr:hypothetical protein BOTBODRAFT_116465 [Botryobasidium botryosum FD-172 SS1]
MSTVKPSKSEPSCATCDAGAANQDANLAAANESTQNTSASGLPVAILPIFEPNQQPAPSAAEDVLDPSTFIPPSSLACTPRIVIEFCDRCRWLHRATWIQTELLLTFPLPTIQAITLVPRNSPETGGRFRVWLVSTNSAGVAGDSDEPKPELLWDRKTQGGFPELKDLKQRVRDRVQPSLSLGHSDKKAVEDKSS